MRRARPKRSRRSSSASACRARLGRCRDQRRSRDRGAERARPGRRLHRDGGGPRNPRGQGRARSPIAKISPTSPAPASRKRRPERRRLSGDLERWATRGVHMHCLNPDRWSSAAAFRSPAPVRSPTSTKGWADGDLVRQAACRRFTPMRSTSPETRRKDEVLAIGDAPADRHARRGAPWDSISCSSRRDPRRRTVPGGFRRRAWARRLAAGRGGSGGLA